MELFTVFSFFLTLFFLIIASYTDIKERIVSNKLNFFALVSGIILYGVKSIYFQSIQPLTLCAIAIFITFIFSYVLYRVGIIAGGDVKLLTALASLNPTAPEIGKFFGLSVGAIEQPFFSIEVFILFALLMLPYASFLLLLRIKKSARIELLKLIIVSTALFVLSLVVPIFNELLFLLASLTFLYFLFNSAIISRFVFTKRVSIPELKEGMIPAEFVFVKGDKVRVEKVFNIKKAFNYIVNPPKNAVANPFLARGLSDEEIGVLKELYEKGKLGSIAVKDSVPAVPAITISYIMLAVFGDILWIFLLGFAG